MCKPYRNIIQNYQHHCYSQQLAWWEDPTYMKDDWKSTSIRMAGEQCVMTCLEKKRLRWRAVCWGSVVERWCPLLRMEPALLPWITWTAGEPKLISGTASTTSGEITTAVIMKTSVLDVVRVMKGIGIWELSWCYIYVSGGTTVCH